MARFDYRREYKNLDVSQMREHLDYQKDKLAGYIHSQSIQDDCVRRISYLKSRIEKKEKGKCQ